jgi:hypothetical protein
MAKPTRSDIITMDYSYFGEPFVQVAAKSGIDTDGLDYSYFGEPFTALTILSGFNLYVGNVQVSAMYVGSTAISVSYVGSVAL